MHTELGGLGRPTPAPDAGRAVVERRGVAGGHRAALTEGGLQRGERSERRVGARALVGVDGEAVGRPASSRARSTAISCSSKASCVGRDGALVAAQREGVLIVTRDASSARRRSRPSRPSPRSSSVAAMRGLISRQPSAVSCIVCAPLAKVAPGFSTQGALLIDSAPPAR